MTEQFEQWAKMNIIIVPKYLQAMVKDYAQQAYAAGAAAERERCAKVCEG